MTLEQLERAQEIQREKEQTREYKDGLARDRECALPLRLSLKLYGETFDIIRALGKDFATELLDTVEAKLDEKIAALEKEMEEL